MLKRGSKRVVLCKLVNDCIHNGENKFVCCSCDMSVLVICWMWVSGMCKRICYWMFPSSLLTV